MSTPSNVAIVWQLGKLGMKYCNYTSNTIRHNTLQMAQQEWPQAPRFVTVDLYWGDDYETEGEFGQRIAEGQQLFALNTSGRLLAGYRGEPTIWWSCATDGKRRPNIRTLRGLLHDDGDEGEHPWTHGRKPQWTRVVIQGHNHPHRLCNNAKDMLWLLSKTRFCKKLPSYEEVPLTRLHPRALPALPPNTGPHAFTPVGPPPLKRARWGVPPYTQVLEDCEHLYAPSESDASDASECGK
jgi:hypothetical protein